MSTSITASGFRCGGRNGHWCGDSCGRLGSRGCGIGRPLLRPNSRNTAHISPDVDKGLPEVRGILVRASTLEGAGFDPVIIDSKHAVASFLLGCHLFKGARANEPEGGHCVGIAAW